MLGSFSGKAMGATGPAIGTILPVFIRAPDFFLIAFSVVPQLSAGDFQKLPGDIALPQLVVFESQVPDQSRGIVRSIRHGYQPGALFTCLSFEECPVKKDVQVESEQV